ncbi:MAG: sigma-54-dependent Fis family transcriptional regulator [Flavobacterium sp.]|nr:sigma-54-dependent Fis family transcriptional regulator [Candidatus Neoflavobacterium equi]
MQNVLVIEDDIMFGKMLQNFLTRNSYHVALAQSKATALHLLQTFKAELVLSDLRLPDVTGMELLTELIETFQIPVVMMTSYADISTAVEAMKLGAADYITKPLQPDEVLAIIKSHLSQPQKKADKPVQKDAVEVREQTFIEGRSEASKRLSQYINLVGPTDFSVLIEGQSGTGKEVLAKRIHEFSKRKGQTFLAVDCGAIPKDLASSEFFGHKKGSFTGAVADKVGYFEAANGGTIFLDEVGNLSYEHQIQLLRAIQERKIKPVGGTQDIPVDIRIIAATNDNLKQAIANGDFREDLYHRLNEFSIQSPSLKDRTDDIILFAEFFLNKVNVQLDKQVIGFHEDVLKLFYKYNWPGNLRELQNVIKKATLLAQGDIIRVMDLPMELLHAPATTEKGGGLGLKSNEKEQIIQALKQADFNKTKAAELLHITRKTLYNKLKEYQIDL